MPIAINIPPCVPSDAHARVQAMVSMLRETDDNFTQVPIEVKRSDSTSVVTVIDIEDPLRGELLSTLVQEALKDGSESIMGDLC
jgi:hypothetical protein